MDDIAFAVPLHATPEERFNNDLADADDIGAGHAVAALYEIIPVRFRHGA